MLALGLGVAPGHGQDWPTDFRCFHSLRSHHELERVFQSLPGLSLAMPTRQEMIRASFSVVKNKLADSKCGCGSSFSALVGRRWSPGSVAVERGRCGGGVSLVPCAANGSWRPPRATRRAQVSPRSERSFQGRLASSLSAMEEWQAEPSSDLWNESVGWKQVKCSSWRVPLQGRRSGIWV